MEAGPTAPRPHEFMRDPGLKPIAIAILLLWAPRLQTHMSSYGISAQCPNTMNSYGNWAWAAKTKLKNNDLGPRFQIICIQAASVPWAAVSYDCTCNLGSWFRHHTNSHGIWLQSSITPRIHMEPGTKTPKRFANMAAIFQLMRKIEIV